MNYREEIKKLLNKADVHSDVIDDVDDILAEIESKVNDARDIIETLSYNLY